jgi:hypothetical protein
MLVAPSSAPATAHALREYLSGKTFNASFANGTRVRSKFGADGSLATSAPSVNEAGKWRAEEGKLCDSLRKIGEFCSEARFDAGILYVRRMSGEIIRYETE